MRTKRLSLLLGILITILLSSFVTDLEFPSLPRIKSVTEWKQWADTTKYNDSGKWLKSRRDYYPNGQLSQMLYVEYQGDTTTLRVYKLNKDSIISRSTWYNSLLKKWMDGDTYYYHKGEKLPYMSNDDGYKCYYTYDDNGRLVSRLLKDDNKMSFAEYQYTYDSTGLMVQQVEFGFFNGEREEKRKYVYEYELTDSGEVRKKDAFFVPHHTQETVTKVDKKGNERTTYYGFTAQTKSITETIYYNDRGERTKKIEYDRENKPSTIWSYDYVYYE